MGLKDIYLKLEDKWYGVLDKIDTVIPINKVVDKIDGIVPSFALFLSLILCIAGILAIPLLLSPQSTVTIIVEDLEGNLLPGVELDYSIGGTVNSATTNENGEVTISIPFNSSVEAVVPEATVEEKEFERAEKTFYVGEEAVFSVKIVLVEKAPPFVERTILFQDSSGQRIRGKAIKVRLSCENPLVTPSPLEVIDLDMDGSITVKEPKDCGIFQIIILEPAEFNQRSYILDSITQTIRLEARNVPKGSLRARIKDVSGNVLVSVNFSVSLLDQDGVKISEKYSQSYGEVVFSDLTGGTYTVSIEDPEGDYGIATQPGITVSADETTAVDIVVSKSIKATLTIEVVDKDNGQRIPNASIRVINSELETVFEKSTGQDAEEILLPLTETGDYTIHTMHEDYLYETVELENVSDQHITIELEKVTEFNSGRMEVRVVDEDSLPVKNARVKLRFTETGMLVPIEPVMTDFNGIARFSGVKPGSYYAYAEKFPAFGDNREQGKEIDIREITRFTVGLIIGNSIIRVEAVDEDMLPVSEAEAEFFSEQGESLGKIPLTDGTGLYELKADKRIYLVVRHPNYMAVQTMPAQLWPEETIEFQALMEPRLILGSPKIQFEGIFDSAGNEANELKSGNRYLVKFKLRIPEEGNFEKGGIHFRVGDEKLLINDPMVIKGVVAGNIEAVLKGTSFTPPIGYQEDSEHITEGDAKWMNIQWNELEPRNYYIGFETRVKSQVTPYTRISLHYRVWAEDESHDYIRTPDDSELGVAESISTKQALYAKTLDLEFLEGQAAECQEDFCYSGESILDEDKGLYVYEPYEMRNGSPHKFTFNILNNSLRQYENSELYITVDGLTIDSYEIQNASAQEISASGIAIKEIEAVDLGAFTKGKSISGSIHLVPNSLGWGSIEVKVIADARVVFLKTITATIVSEKMMRISIDPSFVPSYVATGILVTLHEEELGYEVNNALVRVKIKNPDKTETFYTGQTNGFGNVTFNLPALDPGSVIKIEAEKPGYYAEPFTSTVDSNVLRFTPNSLQARLDTRGTREQAFVVNIENLIGLDVTIEAISLSGRFRGLLDQGTMENFSQQYVGTVIPRKGTETFKMFKAVLSQNAEQLLLRNENLTGEFHITASDRQTGMEWDFIIPLEVDIRLGGLPDNSPCIAITQKEWVSATQGNRASVEFEIRNNCMSGNRFVNLDNLQAKLNWIGDTIGTVELSVTEAATGASNTVVLRSLVWTPLLDQIRAEGVYYAILTFTPKAGHLGEIAEFEVLIDGEIMTDSGLTFVGSNPNTIKSKINVINLEQCIKYVDAENLVEIRESMDEAVFTIDTSECGETNVDIYLCYRDSGCRGGALEGDIGVIPEKFTLRPNNSTKEIKVERRSIPGMYGITVFAKVPGSSYREVHIVDVLIKPEPDEAFYLDKYKFTILGLDATDSTMLTNKHLEEQVNVKASACAWDEASGSFDWGGAAVGAGIGLAVTTMVTVQTGTTFLGSAIMQPIIVACPPCGIAMIVIAIIIGGGLFGDDPCDKDLTYPLPDWIINLEDDAEDVSMDNPLIKAVWITEAPRILGQNEKQEVGITFENLGIEDIKPTYSTATVTAKKHHHAQPTDYGSNSHFGPYEIRDREVSTYTQKFHLKFDTKNVPQEIPQISFESYECTQGTLIGRTGPGSLPRVELNWDWSDSGGISQDACDYGNEDYIYCDATQFSIALSKKLHTFEEFLEINKQNMVCPTSPMERYMAEMQDMFSTRDVQNGRIGLSKATITVSSSDLEVEFEVFNDTGSTQSASITTELTPPSDVSMSLDDLECLREFDVAAQQSKKGKCIFSNLEPSSRFYSISVDIDSSNPDFLDANGFLGSFKLSTETSDSCWIPKSTTLYNGRPAIVYFLEEAPNIVWTPSIPNALALEDLLHFKAFLMKDGFSEDFRKDFAQYSISQDFFNAPDWFANNPDGKMADYFADPFYLDFTRRYVNSNQLPNAGRYDVLLDINFSGDDWEMYDAYAEPNTRIRVELYYLRDPYPNSIFYYLPFNGNIGIDSENGRQGYGTNYDNAAEDLLVVGGGDMVKTANIAGSSPAMNLNTDIIRDFKKINSTASNRGFVLSIEEGEEVNQKDMLFYPNYATPVIMKMSSVKTEDSFSAFYELRQAGTPVENGSNLTFWDGAGRCLDFTGVPVFEAFDFKVDREAVNNDLIDEWQFAYAVDWTKADYEGNVYLKSVFYTPIDQAFNLKTLQPSDLRFITPNTREIQTVELNGISGMQYNSALAHDNVDNLRDIFELVDQGKICVVNTGVRSAFWWNPKTLYETAGYYTSVKAFEQGLEAGQNCIGYGS